VVALAAVLVLQTVLRVQLMVLEILLLYLPLKVILAVTLLEILLQEEEVAEAVVLVKLAVILKVKMLLAQAVMEQQLL
tara:strand:- start:268 stop:501 length:234 start_codon:yes stop_codon:yes gene_type:complete